MSLRRRWLVAQQLLCQWFKSGRLSPAAIAVEAQTLQQLLSLSEIGFILEAIWSVPEYSVEHSELLCIFLSRPKAASFAQLIPALKLRLERIQLVLGPGACEVVAVNTASQPSDLMEKYAGTR